MFFFQAKADEIAKLMNENEHLKIVIEELKVCINFYYFCIQVNLDQVLCAYIYITVKWLLLCFYFKKIGFCQLHFNWIVHLVCVAKIVLSIFCKGCVSCLKRILIMLLVASLMVKKKKELTMMLYIYLNMCKPFSEHLLYSP